MLQKGLQLLHTFTNLFEPIINNLVRKDFDQSAKRLAGTAQDMLQVRDGWLTMDDLPCLLHRCGR